MSGFYCRDCAAQNNFLKVATGINPTGTPYQYEKFLKHTTPSSGTGNSSLDDPYAYCEYMYSATMFGHVVIDRRNRTGLAWDVGKRVGQTVCSDGSIRPDSAILVVCAGELQKAHLYCTASNFSTGFCTGCGKLLVR